MDSNRTDAIPRLIDILKIKSLREHGEINLDRRRLPLAAQGVAHDNVNLRCVEGTVSCAKAPGCTRALQRRFNH